MDPQPHAKINQWYKEQRETLTARGVSEKSSKDAVLQLLIFDGVLHDHFSEIQADHDLFDAFLLEVVRLVPATDLREVAVCLFELGYSRAAEKLNRLVNHKEPGDLPELLGYSSGITKATHTAAEQGAPA